MVNFWSVAFIHRCFGHTRLRGIIWFTVVLWQMGLGLAKSNIALLELYPIVLAVEIWSSYLQNQFIYFPTDNIALVPVINTQTSKDVKIMFLIRRLVISCLRNNVNCRAVHINGPRNILADLLSRQQVEQFHQLAPWTDSCPVPVPNLPDLPF